MEVSGTGLRGAQGPTGPHTTHRDCNPVLWRLRSHAAAEHSQRQRLSGPHSTRGTRLSVVADRVTVQTSLDLHAEANQEVRDGHYEASLVQQQVQEAPLPSIPITAVSHVMCRELHASHSSPYY